VPTREPMPDSEGSPQPFRRRAFLAGIAGVAATAIVAACGSGSATETPKPVSTNAGTSAPPPTAIGGAATMPSAPASTNAATTGTTATTAPAAAGKAIEIEFYHIWGDAQHPANKLIDAFNARSTAVKVKGVVDSADYLVALQKAQAAYAAGKGPALVATPVAYALFADASLTITNLDDVAGSEKDQVYATLNPASLSIVKQNNKTLGMPFAFSCPVMYYNSDTFKAAGIDPREVFKDWDSFTQLGPKMKEKTGSNPITAYLLVSVEWMTQSMIQNAGGRVNDDDGKPAMDSADAVAGIKKIAELARTGLWQNGKDTEIYAAFQSGTIASGVSSIASLSGLRGNAKFDLGVSTFPPFPGKPRRMTMGGSFIGCYARDKEQQKGAWEFLKYAISKEGNDIWMKTGYLNSTKYEVPLLPGQEAAITQLNEGLTRETQWPGSKGSEAIKVWRDYITQVWTNNLSAEEGTQKAKADILKLLPA